MKIIVVGIIIIALVVFGFVKVWEKPLANGGTIKVNTYQKAMLSFGFLNID